MRLSDAGSRPQAAEPARQDGSVRVVVISDTHGPRRWKALPAEIAEAIATIGDLADRLR